MKLYFHALEDRFCYPLADIKAFMYQEDIKELKVFEAERDKVPGMFFCQKTWEPTEKGFCSKNNCSHYTPKNKVSGCCKYYGHLYTPSEKERIVRL
jgi:hypothetical protein